MTTREEKLNSSMIGELRAKYPEFTAYALARKMKLRLFGNPLFAPCDDQTDWPWERSWGQAWVAFTLPWEELAPMTVDQVDGYWAENLESHLVPRLQEYISQSQQLENAAVAEAVPDKVGKPEQGEAQEQPPEN